ncbi:MAG: tyrosine-type recombinase/integrase [Campylobacteraceae bacterium]|jgi:site-specific recombinase XerD|nr:tyrosine-type recombinase/integrase [Campylobacteraceae bacterium]
MSGTKLIKSQKFIGVYYSQLSNGDLSYYIVNKIAGKTKKQYIGKKSEGTTEQLCHLKRNDAVYKARFGDETPIVKYKQKTGITITALIDKYIQSKELSKATTSSYKAINNVFKDERLNEITVDTINKLKITLANDGKAPKTINTYIQRINALFAFAIDMELYKGINPCKKVDKPKSDSNRINFLDKEQINQLKEAIKDKPILLLFVELSLSTGGRLKTITSIKKKDMDFANNKISLKNYKSNNDYKGVITDTLLPLLKQRVGELKNPNDLLITSTSKSIQKQLQPRLNKLFNEGLDTRDAKNRVVIHTLRHTFASHLAIQGTPIFTIMKLLDHKDIKDTLRYAKLAPDTADEAVKGLWNG